MGYKDRVDSDTQLVESLNQKFAKVSEDAELCQKIEKLVQEPFNSSVFAISRQWIKVFKEYSENAQILRDAISMQISELLQS